MLTVAGGTPRLRDQPDVTCCVRPQVQRGLPLEQAAEAHRLLESGKTTGALVLTPRAKSN